MRKESNFAALFFFFFSKPPVVRTVLYRSSYYPDGARYSVCYCHYFQGPCFKSQTIVLPKSKLLPSIQHSNSFSSRLFQTHLQDISRIKLFSVLNYSKNIKLNFLWWCFKLTYPSAHLLFKFSPDLSMLVTNPFVTPVYCYLQMYLMC